MMRSQIDPNVYRNTSSSRNTIGEIMGTIQGISSLADSFRKRGEETQNKADSEYINDVFGKNFAGWNGTDQNDLQVRQQRAVNEVLAARPELYSAVAPKMQEAQTNALALKEKQLDVQGKQLTQQTAGLTLQKQLLENLKWQQDRVGEQFATVDPADEVSYKNAVGHIKALGINANLPDYQTFAQNPTAFYDQLIAHKTQNDQAISQLGVKEKELGIAKSEKELDWYDRLQQASINQKNRTSAGGADITGLSDMDLINAQSLAREIGGVRGMKTVLPSIVSAMKSGLTVDDIRDQRRYATQSTDFTGPARSAMQQLYAGKAGKAADAAFDAFDDLLQAGNKEGAIAFLKRSARNTASADEAKQIAGQERTIQFFDEIQADLDKYQAAGGNTNIFSGNAEKIAGAVGAVNDPKLRNIAQRIQTALQKYRRSMSGVAFSVPESKEYKSLFPGIDKTANFNRETINALKQTFSGDIDFFYENAIGPDAYDALIRAPAGGSSFDDLWKQFGGAE